MRKEGRKRRQLSLPPPVLFHLNPSSKLLASDLLRGYSSQITWSKTLNPTIWTKFSSVRFYVLRAVRMMMAVFLDIAPCNFVEPDQRFSGAHCFQFATGSYPQATQFRPHPTLLILSSRLLLGLHRSLFLRVFQLKYDVNFSAVQIISYVMF
jgi:hypothetical protein